MSTPKQKTKRNTPAKKVVSKRRENSPPDDDLPNLKFYPEEDTDIVADPIQKRNVGINFEMIVRRNLPAVMRQTSDEDVIAALHAVSHVRLDREDVTHIDNLEMLGNHVTNLYLQRNRIQKVENLDCLLNMKFLTLSGNMIANVENLKELNKLKFLDLSENQIEVLDVDELPISLVILSLEGNPCTSKEGYRERVMTALPGLRQLDGVDLTAADSEESESTDEDEEDVGDGVEVAAVNGRNEEGNIRINYEDNASRSLDDYMISASKERPDVFIDVIDDLRHRSKVRVAEMDEQHLQHQEILKKIRQDSRTARVEQ